MFQVASEDFGKLLLTLECPGALTMMGLMT